MVHRHFTKALETVRIGALYSRATLAHWYSSFIHVRLSVIHVGSTAVIIDQVVKKIQCKKSTIKQFTLLMNFTQQIHGGINIQIKMENILKKMLKLFFKTFITLYEYE